jgi:hypothetical protein
MTENTASQSKPLFNLLHSSYKFILEAVCALSAPCDLLRNCARKGRKRHKAVKRKLPMGLSPVSLILRVIAADKLDLLCEAFELCRDAFSFYKNDPVLNQLIVSEFNYDAFMELLFPNEST